MKTLMTAGLLLLGASSAHADVLNYDFCGHLNRSTQICLASAGKTSTSGRSYFIVRQDFTKDPVFMSASVKYLNPGVAGVGAAQYTGTFVGENDGQPSGPATPHQYVLIIRQVIAPNAPITGGLSIDGSRAQHFEMQRMMNVD